MMIIKKWIENVGLSLKVGTPVKMANNLNPIEQVTIRYKDFYFFVDIDVESGEPTGSFGWSEDPTMNPTTTLREIWTASPPNKELFKEIEQ